MSTIEKKNKHLSLTVKLADRLVEDIKTRRLKAGEHYMTAQEASKFLGVAGATANRALQLLEKRQVIRRAQKKGAIILEPPTAGSAVIDQVHFLVHDKYYRTEGVGGDGILMGVQSELPTSFVSHCFLTTENEVEQVSRLIDRSFAENTTTAFILVRASYDIQRLLAKSGLPCIVYGSIYEGLEGMSQIDRNHHDVIRLVIDHFRKRYCSHIAVLMRQQVMPGDHQTLDALSALRDVRLTFRFTPQEDTNIEAEVRSILAQPHRPEAFLCQTLRHAECVERVRKELRIPRSKLEIVVLTTYLKSGEKIPFPHIVLFDDPEMLGRRLGALILKSMNGEHVRETVSVKLVMP